MSPRRHVIGLTAAFALLGTPALAGAAEPGEAVDAPVLPASSVPADAAPSEPVAPHPASSAGVPVEEAPVPADPAPVTPEPEPPAPAPEPPVAKEPVPVAPAPVDEPVQEAVASVPVPVPVGAPEGSPVTPAAAPSQTARQMAVTLQRIVQIQMGCLYECHGTLQIQAARNIARTAQGLVQEQLRAGGRQSASQGSRTVQTIHQVQIGCRSRCFGARTVKGTVKLRRRVVRGRALRGRMMRGLTVRGRNLPGSVTKAKRTVSVRTVRNTKATTQKAGQRQLAGVLPQQVARQISWVQQLSNGRQAGCLTNCRGDVLVQTSFSTSVTTQEIGQDQASAAGLAGAGQAAVQTSVTVQTTYQYQVGCLAFCYGTVQVQTAVQVSATIQGIRQRQGGELLPA